MHCSAVLFSGWISWYLTSLLSQDTSPRLCPGNPTCLLSLDFSSTCFLSACCLPGLTLWRLGLCLPTKHPGCCQLRTLNIANKVLNRPILGLCCSWVRSHTRYNINSLLSISQCGIKGNDSLLIPKGFGSCSEGGP